MIVSAAATSAEPRRKRLRKGTKSCCECKRKKVKCTYSSESASVCSGCHERGTPCLSQELGAEPASNGLGGADNSALALRMERVESLLERVMGQLSQFSEAIHINPRSEPMGLPSSAAAVSQDPELTEQSLSSRLSSHPTQSGNALRSADALVPKTKNELLRERLSSQLPCQDDVNYLLELSHGWWLIRKHFMPYLLTASETHLQQYTDVSYLSKSDPIIIARCLLCIAICIQQLPHDSDLGNISTKKPLREMMEANLSLVTEMVTSNDEMTASFEGLECLILQGIYQLNAGNLRRSWLLFRRAVNVAELLGFHRATPKISSEAPGSTEICRHHMWFQIIQGERYLSLMLGVPSATGSISIPFDDDASCFSPEEVYSKRLCDISGLILARNHASSNHSFSATQEIEEKLESIARQMPPSWWEIPTIVMGDCTEEAASQFERILCQIWHFELGTLLHLPFMLRATGDRRYEYSRISCLSAARGLIKRWLALHGMQGTALFSNLITFQAFAAAVTLLLGLLGPNSAVMSPAASKERHDDFQLVGTIIQRFEMLRQSRPGDHVVDQSISVIRTLQSVLRNEGSSSGTLRLEIPHFGTITIARGGAIQSPEGGRILGANEHPVQLFIETNSSLRARPLGTAPTETSPWPEGTSPIQPSNCAYEGGNMETDIINGNAPWIQSTLLDFTSSHLPNLEAPEGLNNPELSLREEDVILFDSLLSMDVGGNWEF